MPEATIRLQRTADLWIELDSTSVLDLRSVQAGGVDWAPGLAIVDDGDPRIWHALQGFLFTVGPDHIRHPEPFDAGEGRYPLHGSASGHPACDITVEEGGAACRAVIPMRLAEGGEATLHRRWHIDEAGTVHLSDRLVNSGARAFPPMMLYHINIDSRLFGPETRLDGAMIDGGGLPWRYGREPGSVFCVPASEGPEAEVRLGPVPAAQGLTLAVSFDTATIPHLQIWRNQAEGIAVFGIEPCSHRWEKRPVLREAGELVALQPGESRDYALRFSFS